MTEIQACIENRRSNRIYTTLEVDKERIRDLLVAAGWAPSGKNKQPWKFVVIKENKLIMKQICALSAHNTWLQHSPSLIAVYLDKEKSYDYTKDVLAVGASIQNILLRAYDMGLGTCWVGEILKNENEVNQLLGISSNYQLMSVVAVGYPKAVGGKGKRISWQDNVLNWI